jgi:NAD(P)-dependent dehydrogenase (short-subunit alcohol dehydrogenase family)
MISQFRPVRDPAEAARVFLVTGATGAIGLAIAKQLAATPSAEVVLACRSGAQAIEAVRDIRERVGETRLRYELVDVARRSSIEALVRRWAGPLHVLVNNAAATPRRREETPEGIELQFATNVLGYLWMTQAFAEILRASAPARVVNVASYWAGDLDPDDLQFTRRRYNNHEAYRQSKQANRMLTVALAVRLAAQGITVNACHPGNVSSRLSNNLGFRGHQTPDEGARTPVWLAVGTVGGQVSGRYFEDRRETRCPFGQDSREVEALYRACCRFCP